MKLRSLLGVVVLSAFGSYVTVQAEDVGEGLVEGGSATITARNMYFNRNSLSHYPDARGWGQGFQMDYQSGFTQGEVGLGLDASAYTAYKLDGGRGTVGTGMLEQGGVGFYVSQAQDLWRQYYVNGNYSFVLTAEQTLGVDFNLYRSLDQGQANAGDINVSAWSLATAYANGPHTLTLSYQKIHGGQPFDYLMASDGTYMDSIYLANSSQYGDFNGPGEQIQSATVVAADLLNWQQDVGAVSVGRFADMIAVEGDPLADIAILEKTPVVMKGGAIVPPDVLPGM